MVLLKFQIPLSCRQFLAEILGTFLLASLTHGAVAQSLGKNEILNPLAPGLALMIGILASGSYEFNFFPKNTVSLLLAVSFHFLNEFSIFLKIPWLKLKY